MATNQSFDDVPSEEPITIQPSGTAFPGPGELMPAGSGPGQDAINPMALLHAFRRHFPVIVSIALACGTVTALLLSPVNPWFGLKPTYKAEAALLLLPSDPHILARTPDQDVSTANEFEIFRDTQQNLIKQRFVIMAALRDPKLKNRPCIRQQDAVHNAAAWLTEEIHVEFAKNAGIMKVTATEPDREDSAAIVNAVVDAYMQEVVNVDRQKRRDRLSELQQIAAEKEIEVRKEREQLKRELENMGAGDDETMKARGALAMSSYAWFMAEFQKMKGEHRVLLGKLREANASLQDLRESEIPESEVAMVLNTNPSYHDLQTRFTYLRQLTDAHTQAVTPTQKTPPGYVRTKAEFENADKQLAELKEEARNQVRAAKRIALESEIKHLKNQEQILAEQTALFEKEVERKQNEADNIGKSSIAAQMARSEVENVERILHAVTEEKERLQVELKSPPRINVLGDPNAPAAVPENEAHDLRLVIIAFGSLLAMLLPTAGILVWDLFNGRVNSVDDVSKRLQIPVIGTVPLIPATVMRRLGDTTHRSQMWRVRFTEAVDGVAVRLMHKAECDQARVILITSALAGEGKTTLATQLAMALARARRKTVLVDFDLRQPTLDGAMGLPAGPGVCEALRGRRNVADMARRTETENLFVVTAGSWSRQVLADLSSDAIDAMMEQLRANFDFVIIDSSPLLPVVDTRLVCRHVDAVVLSVLRDVSQGPKVLAAREMLEAFGVRSVEAVVTGGEEHGNARSTALRTMMFDEQDEQFAQVEPVADERPRATK